MAYRRAVRPVFRPIAVVTGRGPTRELVAAAAALTWHERRRVERLNRAGKPAWDTASARFAVELARDDEHRLARAARVRRINAHLVDPARPTDDTPAPVGWLVYLGSVIVVFGLALTGSRLVDLVVSSTFNGSLDWRLAATACTAWPCRRRKWAAWSA